MKSNISQGDKLVRLTLGISILLLAAFTKLMWLGIIGLIFLITALLNYCPLYSIFSYSSRKYHKSPFQAKQKKKTNH